MKILELRFKNLNSLYGEWIIDFTDPEYVSSGIFSLTGPTGAGKSTILDAICLALYGATPRLGKITKSGNDIMSRQTGECYAEVLFESQAGRFRCHWEQRRARKRADGNLQDQEHQIADGDTNKPIETKKSLVTTVIEEKTGMDFDRFTRSILLAQGGFDTFLKADVEQKSKILEQLTGTGIYSEISCRIHERQRDEREKLNLLKAEISGIMILEPEQEKEIRSDLEAKLIQETDLTGKATETGKAIAWFSSIDGLKKEISSLDEEVEKLKSDIESFKPEREKLERAIKAVSLEGSYATLVAIRKQQSDDLESLKADETALPQLESSANVQAEALKSTEQQTVKAKEDLKKAAPLIQKIRLIDQKITEQAVNISNAEKSCQKDVLKIEADKKARLKEQEKRIEADKNIVLANSYLKEHKQDEWLISGLAGVEEQLVNLLAKQKELLLKEADLKKADKSLAQAIKRLEDNTKKTGIRKQELADASKQLQQGKDTLRELLGNSLLREYRTEKETLLREMAFHSKIAKLEDYRAKLEDGKPCPLCGSKEHPFAEGNVPSPDETEKKIEALTRLITKAEDLETGIKKHEESEAAARNHLTESEKLEAETVGEKRNAEKARGDLTDGIEKFQAGFLELKQAISAKLNAIGFPIDFSNPQSAIQELTSKLQTWQTQVRKRDEAEKQIAGIDSEINRLDAIIETQNTTLIEKLEHLEILKKEQAARSDERKILYGDKNPDNEEDRLNKVLADAEANEKKARDRNIDLQQKLTTAKTHVASLKKSISQREPELKKAESDFFSALEPAGFSDETQFLEAKLTVEKRNTLSARAKKLDETQMDLQARRKDRATRLEEEIAKKVTDKSRDELEPQFKEYKESLEVLRDAIASLKIKLRDNSTAKERVKEKQIDIEAQGKECHRWEKLHGLIGSADGKKYRNFAQGLTFELMVSHANRQLEKMTDRYLLIRDADQPLELNVVDNYQAGEIRTTKNLSGGESFIVSLTLALGLSKMASRKVRVDSLFLDEGFGTLDEETLETSLETLSGLQQDGKLIGIISHISALKERIRAQIKISPVSGGKSTLYGPGCSKVEK